MPGGLRFAFRIRVGEEIISGLLALRGLMPYRTWLVPGFNQHQPLPMDNRYPFWRGMYFGNAAISVLEFCDLTAPMLSLVAKNIWLAFEELLGKVGTGN